jgi:16S rRNA processing protein RimM
VKQPYVECGRVTTTHGVRGAVKIDPWCDSPKQLAALDVVYLRSPDGTFSKKALKNPSVSGDRVIAYIGEAASLDDALLLRGKTLYAAREDLRIAPGRVLIADLIGLPVIDLDSGRVYGTLTEILPSPSADLYEVTTADNRRVLIPDVDEFIKERDPERGVLVRLIPGIFEDED